jgi:spectrin alpha
MREKEPIASNTDYGKDEDSAEALLKKHEAFLSDLEAYSTVIEGLHDQAQACKVSCYCSFTDFTNLKYK